MANEIFYLAMVHMVHRAIASNTGHNIILFKISIMSIKTKINKQEALNGPLGKILVINF